MILGVLWDWIADGTLWTHLQSTLTVMTEGYVIGCARRRRHRIPARIFSAPVPRGRSIARGPLRGAEDRARSLFVILLGVDNASKVALVAVTVFFLVLTSTVEGVREVDRGVVNALF